jgi:MazG family protein
MPESEAGDGERPYRPGLPAIFDVVERLRAPDGCPWDREQTHRSLRPYLLEETYELLEALDLGDDEKVLEELGDVLLQVAMHAQMASEEGRFDAARVSEAGAAKMVSRHPHVFGDVAVADAEEVLRNWERQKLAAAGAGSALERVPRSLPALAWATALQKRAARVGVDPAPEADAAAGITEKAQALANGSGPEAERELGDLLFAVVSLARRLRINPEDALREAGERFAARFGEVEARARERGTDLRELGPEELAELSEP